MRSLIVLAFSVIATAQIVGVRHRGVTAAAVASPPARVQSTKCESSSAPVTCTLSSNATAGNALIAFISYGGSPPCTITSTPSNTWTLWNTGKHAGTEATQVFVATNVASATNAIVATCPGATNWVSEEVVEVTNATTVDVTGATSASSSSVSIATAQAVGSTSEYVACAASQNSDYRTWTAGSGYTIRQRMFISGGPSLGALADGDSNTGLSGIQTCAMTLNSSIGFSGAVVALSNTAAAQGRADAFFDFEGLTDTVAPTNAALIASSRGQAGDWDATQAGGTRITGATAGQLSNFVTTAQLGATAWTGSGGLGLAYATGGSTSIKWTPPVLNSAISWGHWFRTSITNSETVGNGYSLTFAYTADADYNGFQLQATGSALHMYLECSTGPSSGFVTIQPNTTYWLTNKTTNGSGTNQGAVYDSAGAQVGSTLSCTAGSGTGTIGTVRIGVNGAEAQDSGHILWFDDFLFSLSGTFPLLP